MNAPAPLDWSVTYGPIHLIRYRGTSKVCLRRIARNETAKYLAEQKQYAAAARHEMEDAWDDDHDGQ